MYFAVGFSFAILIIWVIISCISLPFNQWFVRRKDGPKVEATDTQDSSSHEMTMEGGSKVEKEFAWIMNQHESIYPAWIPPLELRIFKLIKRRYLYLDTYLILYYIYRTSITQFSGFRTHHLSLWFMIGSFVSWHKIYDAFVRACG